MKLITECGYEVYEVDQRLGATDKSLHDWIKRHGNQGSQRQTISAQQEELRRVTKERDILKGPAAHFANESKRGKRS